MAEKAGLKANSMMVIMIAALVLWGGYQVYEDIIHPIPMDMMSLNAIQQLQCRWAAEGAVKQALKDPSTVSFQYDRVKPPHHNNQGNVIVAGYVGVPTEAGPLRKPFKVILDETFNDVISVSIATN